TLTGTSDLGPVSLTTTTAADGSYQFTRSEERRVGKEGRQRANYLDGKEEVGSLGGTLANDQVSAIALSVGAHGVHYDFGELLPASLAGYVYLDANDYGVNKGLEFSIVLVRSTLTGTSDLGPVSLTTTTAADGSYQFT